MGGSSMENAGDAGLVDQEAPSRKLHWKEEVTKACTLQEVDLECGRNGWAEPSANGFQVRGENYFAKKVKTPSGDSLLEPLGMDWLKSSSKLEHVLSHPANIMKKTLERAHAEGEGLKAFVLAVNLMIPGMNHHSAVFYFVTEEPIRQGSLLYRFIHGDDAFRNSRFKLINRIVRGPWIVRAAAGNHTACLLGKALTCHYINGPNYLEIDVDIGSSTVANAILHLALGYVTSVAVDLAFLIESQTDEELPERLLGAVRVAHMEIEGATHVEARPDGADKSPHSNSLLHGHSSWRMLGRSLSMLAAEGKIGRVHAEEGQG